MLDCVKPTNGYSSAVGAYKTDNLILTDREANILDRREGSVAFGDRPDIDHDFTPSEGR
jgi:hypothetical protein